MKILHRYLAGILLRNLLFALLVTTFLFLVFEFFDRIDNLVAAQAPAVSALLYFVYKVPLIFNLMLPISVLVATLLTYGLLSKSSEITAMRAAGLPMSWLARPILVMGTLVSLFSIFLQELVIPTTQRRAREIYNIDIQQKDATGGYSQSNFWWRKDNNFFSVNEFDSRTNTLLGLSKFVIDPQFIIRERVDAQRIEWVDPLLGWTMRNVTEYRFTPQGVTTQKKTGALPLPMRSRPEEFYDTKADPHTMSFRSLNRFIKEQRRNGLNVEGYLPDLYEKLAFPFISFIMGAIVLPFSLKPARSGSLAVSFLAALVIGFSYYAVHAFSLAMGRAELWPPLLAAWMANLVMGFIAYVLNVGAESPS